MNKIMNNVVCNTPIEMGTEVKLSTFYDDLAKFGIQWECIDRKYEPMIARMCESAVTDFAIELRSVAAGFAVVSTDSHMYRNPFTKLFVYRRGLAHKWAKIMLEMYINEAKYVWDRNYRKKEVYDFLDKRDVHHSLMKYFEDRVDILVNNHYLGPEMVDMAIDGYAEIKRNDWQNKIERVTGEVISMW